MTIKVSHNHDFVPSETRTTLHNHGQNKTELMSNAQSLSDPLETVEVWGSLNVIAEPSRNLQFWGRNVPEG